MHLLMLATAVSVALEPLTSFDFVARVHASCPDRCQVREASLDYVTGEIAVASTEAVPCTGSVPLFHVPLGAHLVPHVSWQCDGGAPETATGRPVTLAPYLGNVELDGADVLIDALAEPRGTERLQLQVWALDGGFELTRDFPSNDLVLRGTPLPPGAVAFRAVLEPYGIPSNTRVMRLEPPRLRWTATSAGCASTPVLIPLVFFLRRRFPSVRPIC